MDIGSQYKPDDKFKVEARLFQSKYRAEVFQANFQDYGNHHFHETLPEYTSRLTDDSRSYVAGCTFEKFIAAIGGTPGFNEWRTWLEKRYVFRSNG